MRHIIELQRRDGEENGSKEGRLRGMSYRLLCAAREIEHRRAVCPHVELFQSTQFQQLELKKASTLFLRWSIPSTR